MSELGILIEVVRSDAVWATETATNAVINEKSAKVYSPQEVHLSVAEDPLLEQRLTGGLQIN